MKKLKIFINKYADKLVISFLVPYLCILSLTIIIALLGYFEAFRILKEDIKEYNLSLINQSKDIVDQKMQTLKLAAIQMSADDRVNNVSNVKEDDPHFPYLDFKNTVDNLFNYRLTLDKSYIYDYYVYFKKSNYIATTEAIYKPENFYKNVLTSTEMSYEEWVSKVLNKTHDGDCFHDNVIGRDNRQKASVITYVKSIMPFSFDEADYNGTLVIMINQKGVNDLFSRVDLSNGGWIYIQDKDGQIVANIAGDTTKMKSINLDKYANAEGFFKESIDNKDMIVTYTTSQINGWKYVLVLPDETVMDKSNNFRTFILVVLAFGILIGILLAAYMAYNNTKPVNSILSNLTENVEEYKSQGKQAVYNTINNTITTLISDNKSLEERIKQHGPIILSAFTDRLLKGEFGSIKEIEANISYIGMNFQDAAYLVLIVRMYDRKDVSEINQEIIYELNAVKVLLKETFSNCFNEDVLYKDIDSQNMAVILNFNSELNYKDNINKMIKNISDEFDEKYRMKILFGIGNVYKSLGEIWRSYQEALETLNYIQLHKENIKWYDEVPKETELYYYPMDFEQRIISYVKAGDFEQIKSMFAVISNENFSNRKLSPNVSNLLFYDIKGTTIKLLQQIPKNEELLNETVNMDFNKPAEESLSALLNIYSKMCDIVNENKSDRNQNVINKIIKYIENNYMNFDLSLNIVASEFHFSEGYLSYFFKEQTGQNFIEFIEKLRIKEACELLKNTELNINEIAEKIGYNNVQSFRRAFKKVEGVNPSTLRR